MSAAVLLSTEEFFAPVASDLVGSIVGQYRAERAKVEEIASYFSDTSYRVAVNNFTEGSRDSFSRFAPEPSTIFDLSKALPVLNATYWDRALKMTDVLNVMPQKRRDEWFEQIRCPQGKKRSGNNNEWEVPPIPEFTEEAVRSTLGDLLLSRGKFFAERVDGIFRGLSRTHVTNCPQGFSKRMIIAGAITSYDTVNSSTAGLINDLRCIVAKFMGRDDPHYTSTDAAMKVIRRRNGEWMSLDAGNLRMRIYNGVGTAHLEVHPEMAWRLNAILASLYPASIPSEFREKPKRKIKDFVLMERPLPFLVVEALAGLEEARELNPNRGFRDNTFIRIHNAREFRRHSTDKHVTAEAEQVLLSIGGVKTEKGYFQFDYDPDDVIGEIVCSGCVPDHKSHQFYPTPKDLAQRVIDLADIMPGHTCLEPSAGTGGLADLVPACRHMTCIEVSELHAAVLRAKGHYTLTGDFLNAASLTQHATFDRVVMNPPFDQGRWRAHLEAAANKLAADGRLVAILPSGAKQKDDLLQGFALNWHGPFDNQFPGASVSVVILVAERCAA